MIHFIENYDFCSSFEIISWFQLWDLNRIDVPFANSNVIFVYMVEQMVLCYVYKK